MADAKKELDVYPDGKWRNLWWEIFQEEWGKEEAEKRLAEFHNFKSPEPGFLSRLNLTLTTYKLVFGIAMSAWKLGMRPSHRYGAGARGTCRILDGSGIPENEFFIPGREFRVRVRHAATRSGEDDAQNSARAGSIKFDDVEEGGPLDLLMNTGSTNPFFNLPTWAELSMPNLANNDEAAMKKACYGRPFYLESMIDSARRAPESFTHMRFYSLITYVLQGKDGTKRFVRFRMVPDDVLALSVESGMSDLADQRAPWQRERSKDETRPLSYLRDHYKAEVTKRELKYHLEIQVHKQPYTDEPNDRIYNTAMEWDQADAPWGRLAEILLKLPLTDEETENTRFDISNRPECLMITPSQSVHDCNSMFHVRQRVYKNSQKMRISK